MNQQVFRNNLSKFKGFNFKVSWKCGELLFSSIIHLCNFIPWVKLFKLLKSFYLDFGKVSALYKFHKKLIRAALKKIETIVVTGSTSRRFVSKLAYFHILTSFPIIFTSSKLDRKCGSTTNVMYFYCDERYFI